MSLGFGQIIIIVIVILLIFGASRLPRIAEDLAKGMKAFKKGLADDDATPGGDDVSAPSHLVRAKPARVAPAKKVVKSTSHTKKPAANAVVTKTVASKTVSSKSSAAVKSAKTSGTKKSPSKKSVLHV